jgi:hypothetical protein
MAAVAMAWPVVAEAEVEVEVEDSTPNLASRSWFAM